MLLYDIITSHRALPVLFYLSVLSSITFCNVGNVLDLCPKWWQPTTYGYWTLIRAPPENWGHQSSGRLFSCSISQSQNRDNLDTNPDLLTVSDPLSYEWVVSYNYLFAKCYRAPSKSSKYFEDAKKWNTVEKESEIRKENRFIDL